MKGKHKDNGSDFLLKEILKKITVIEEEVEKLKSKPEYHINVEKLEVQQLENMIFRLDAMDIKELSGTLNIGNNFDSKKPPVKSAGNSSKDDKSKKSRREKEDS